jgi:hypothetical protein
MCSRTVLFIIGILLILMGIAGLIPGINIGTEPVWHACAKIVMGIVAVIVPIVEKPKKIIKVKKKRR